MLWRNAPGGSLGQDINRINLWIPRKQNSWPHYRSFCSSRILRARDSLILLQQNESVFSVEKTRAPRRPPDYSSDRKPECERRRQSKKKPPVSQWLSVKNETAIM